MNGPEAKKSLGAAGGWHPIEGLSGASSTSRRPVASSSFQSIIWHGPAS